MKTKKLLLLSFMIISILSCQKDNESSPNGLATFTLSIQEANTVNIGRIQSVATDDFAILIIDKSNDEEVASYERYADMPSSVLLRQGEYKVVASNGTETTADFDNPVYYGESDLSITAGETSDISIECLLSNIKVQITHTEDAKTRFPDVYTEVTTGNGTLQYTQTESRHGYFALNGDPTTLTINIHYTQDGNSRTTTKTYEANANDFFNITINASLDGEGGIEIGVGDENVIEDEIVIGEKEETVSLFTWQKIIYETSYQGVPEVKSILQIEDNNYIIAGKDRGYAWLSKYDLEGNRVWNKYYFTPEGYYPSSEINVVKEINEGLIVAGYRNVDGIVNDGEGTFIMKLDALGDSLWSKFYIGEDIGVIHDMFILSDGGYMLVSFAYQSTYLVKVDEIGTIEWKKKHVDINPYSVAMTSEGNYVIAGQSDDKSGYTLYLNSEGDYVWSKIISASGYIDPKFCDVTETSAGNLLFLGVNEGDDGTSHTWVVKMNKSGNVIWDKTFIPTNSLLDHGGGGENNYGCNYLIETFDGNFILSGISWDISTQLDEFYLLKFDKDGNRIWDKKYDFEISSLNTKPTKPRYIIETKDKGLLIAGLIIQGTSGERDTFLLKLDEDGNQ